MPQNKTIRSNISNFSRRQLSLSSLNQIAGFLFTISLPFEKMGCFSTRLACATFIVNGSKGFQYLPLKNHHPSKNLLAPFHSTYGLAKNKSYILLAFLSVFFVATQGTYFNIFPKLRLEYE